jgi:hypothetical protein
MTQFQEEGRNRNAPALRTDIVDRSAPSGRGGFVAGPPPGSEPDLNLLHLGPEFSAPGRVKYRLAAARVPQ